MYSKQFKFNKETLQYEEVKLNLISKLLLFSTIALALGLYIWGSWTLMSPVPLKQYLLERTVLKSKIQSTHNKLDQLSGELAMLKEKDDNLYRSTLELNRIDNNLWMGGYGGSVKNPDLERLQDGDKLVSLADKMSKVKHQMSVVAESQEVLINKAGGDEKRMRALPAIRPIITMTKALNLMSGFGMRIDPVNKTTWQMHPGLDIGAPMGTPIFATGDGMVVRVEYKTYGYGLNVVIDHGYGYKTLYAHMSKIDAKVGQKIKRGQIIGYVGSTGYSTCPHVHYEVFVNDIRVNPMPYISRMSNDELKEIAKSVNPDVNFGPNNRIQRRRP